MKQVSYVIGLACAFLTIGLAVLAVITHRFGWSRPLEMLSHFQMQYFAITSVLAAIALLSKRTSFIGIALFCTALLSAHIVPWYWPSTAVRASANYRVLSTNLNVGNSSAEPVLAWTQQEQPDLAVFIEVNDSMAQQLEVLKAFMPYSSNQSMPYQPGTVLYSKQPLTGVKIEKFDTNDAVNLIAHVEVEGQALSLVAIHPVPPMNSTLFDSRNRAFAAVSDYVRSQSDPVVLIGDFNTTMWSPYYQTLASQTGLKNTRKGFGTLPTWPVNLSTYFPPAIRPFAQLANIPIDHCLVSPSLQVSDMRVGPNVGSDHLPIAIDLSIS